MYTSEKPDLDYLAHYGVKGMRWGVRKDRGSDSSNRYSRKRQRLEKSLSNKKSFHGTAKLEKKVKKAQYAEKAYLEEKTKVGRAWAQLTDWPINYADMMYSLNDAPSAKGRVKELRSQYKAGQGFVDKIWDGLTDFSRYAARVDYDKERYMATRGK